MENYLKTVPFTLRKNLTKLRLSDHSLAIETGRYHQSDISKRLCELCDDNSIEDESHFISKCPFYKRERLQFMEKINFLDLGSDDEKNLNFLMSCSDVDVCNTVCEFINLCSESRREHIANIRHNNPEAKPTCQTNRGRTVVPPKRLIECL